MQLMYESVGDKPSGGSEISDLLRDPCRGQNKVTGRTLNPGKPLRTLLIILTEENKMHIICKGHTLYMFYVLYISADDFLSKNLFLQIQFLLAFALQT